MVSPAVSCSAPGYSVLTQYDEQGFLTTETVPIGISTGWDEQGFATTVYAASCTVSNIATAIKAARVEAVSLRTITSSGLVILPSADATVASASTKDSGTGGQSRVQWAAMACIMLISMIWIL